MFNFHKKKAEDTKHDYVIWYLNNQLSPLVTEIRKAARNIYIKQKAARVFPSDDNPYLVKLNLTFIDLHTQLINLRAHLVYLMEKYDKERHEVIKMIDEHNLEITCPPEGYEIVENEVKLILEGK